ncbi:acyl-CoA dehydrogenase family protein [Rhodococcus zopfii]|uniref:acyl-CoA dehydrogenase family protein n=1 Tax=Rhodococcus zopfii TaxID=43772 RepID=UPI0009331DB2
MFLPETRHQFGRPIGSYQALHNRATQMWIAATQARATSRYAAAILASDGPDAGVAASLAKANYPVRRASRRRHPSSSRYVG